MNLNSAALKLMAAKGLTLADVADIVAATEQTRDPTAAERQARCRARKRGDVSRRDVTRDPLNEDNLNPAVTPTPDGVGPKPVTKSRGSRLAADWALPVEWRQWAKERRGWSDKDVGEEAEVFANYWQAKSGAGACHTDWFKTWRNWVIRSHRADGNAPEKVNLTASQWRERAEWYARRGNRESADECKKKAIEMEQRQAA
jgi:hypothetical protein